MGNDIILFASKNGTTKDTVNKIKKSCRKDIKFVDLNGNDKIDLEKYDRIIIGSGIYASRLNSEVANFLKTNCNELKSKELVFFIHGLDAENSYNEIIKKGSDSQLVNFTAFYLGGRLDVEKQNFFVRLLLGRIAKKKNLDAKNMSTLNEKKIDEFIEYVSA